MGVSRRPSRSESVPAGMKAPPSRSPRPRPHGLGQSSSGDVPSRSRQNKRSLKISVALEFGLASWKTNVVSLRVKENSTPEGPSGMRFRVARNVGIKLGSSEQIRAEIFRKLSGNGVSGHVIPRIHVTNRPGASTCPRSRAAVRRVHQGRKVGTTSAHRPRRWGPRSGRRRDTRG